MEKRYFIALAGETGEYIDINDNDASLQLPYRSGFRQMLLLEQPCQISIILAYSWFSYHDLVDFSICC